MSNMPQINLRENFLKFIHHEKTDLIPCYLGSVADLGCGMLPGPEFEGGPVGGGYDGFGVRWLTPASGGGAGMPAPNEFVLDDITEWRSKVTIPNVDAYDWAGAAERELANVDRSAQLVNFGVGGGVFMRLTDLMGFEESLISMVSDPEEVDALFTAITDYKIKMLEKAAEYYKPEMVTYADDVATERSLFMSREMFQTLIKPHHKRFVDACKALGIIPIYHCCGKADAIIEDMIDCGWAAWTVIQPSNDICGMIEKYGDRIGFIGGFDSNGAPARPDTSDEIITAEIKRCLDTYGSYGYGYSFFGFRFVNSLNFEDQMQAMGFIINGSIQYAFELYAKKMMGG